MHALARFDSERRHDRRIHLRNECGNTIRDRDAVLVELALPQEAGEDRAAQSGFRVDDRSRRTLVSARGRTTENMRVQIEQIQTCHDTTRSVAPVGSSRHRPALRRREVRRRSYSSSSASDLLLTVLSWLKPAVP